MRPRNKILCGILIAGLGSCAALLGAQVQGEAASMPAASKKAPVKEEQKKKPAKKKPADDLDYWLRRGRPVPATAPGSSVDKQPANASPLRRKEGFRRDDALPGVIELSDGTQLPGGIFTTRNKPWVVWVAKKKRWRRIPPLCVLSITAVVVQEKMELKWRWKAMGEPEKVYTGEKYPFRRFLWKFHLIDGTYITGSVKGQPIWVETPDGTKTSGPFILHERSKGSTSQKLSDLIYVKKVVISRKMMEKVIKGQSKIKSFVTGKMMGSVTLSEARPYGRPQGRRA